MKRLSWWPAGVRTGPRCSQAIARAVDYRAYWRARKARGDSAAAGILEEASKPGGATHILESIEGMMYLQWVDGNGEEYPNAFPEYFR